MTVGPRFGTGELQGFNVDYQVGRTHVDRHRDVALSRAIAANDFTNLRDAVDTAYSHNGAEHIDVDDNGHFHLSKVLDGSATGISFPANISDGLMGADLATYWATKVEQGGQMPADAMDRVRQEVEAAGPSALPAAQRLEAALQSHGKRDMARTLHRTIAEYSPLQGATVQNGHYANPEAILNQVGQRDALTNTIRDADRCGPASVVGAAIMRGPQALQALANQFHVEGFDANHLTAASVHHLMEEVYEGTVSHRQGNSGGTTGLGSWEVNSLMMGHYSPSAPQADHASARAVAPSQVNWGAIGPNQQVSVLIHPNANAGNEHFVTAFRGNDGQLKVYDPDPASGSNVLSFDSPSALGAWMQQHQMSNGQIEVLGGGGVNGLIH